MYLMAVTGKYFNAHIYITIHKLQMKRKLKKIAISFADLPVYMA